jgi:hypothetical protein
MTTSDDRTNSAASAGDKRLLRADLIIATLALLASMSATIAVIVQTRTIANQLSASVWPYLTFEITSGAHEITASIVNEGLGPALVRSFAVSLDGRPQTRLRDVVAAFDPKRHGLLTTTDLGGGVVIRPGETTTLFHLNDPRLDIDKARPGLLRADARLCYCSLLGNCWTLDAKGTEPLPIRSCGPPTPRVEY